MIKTKTPTFRSSASFSNSPLAWLGGLTPKQFMHRHWQKKPLLVRGAFPHWQSKERADRPIDQEDVFKLTERDELSVRFVDNSYSVRHGPFRRRQLPSLKKPGWTILVQQTNTLWPQAEAFLDHFRFVPNCRLDDLMVSLASDQGGIGAHVDSYDVFLIQAFGHRRWEIAETFCPELRPDLDLKILKTFKPEASYDMQPGDLLYLPPGVAHRGIALGTGCMTYSVGFRAPNRLEIADASFMAHLSELADSPWQDPWLESTDSPSRLPNRLLKNMTDQVMACLPTREHIENQVIAGLSEPAPMVYFTPPDGPCAKSKVRFKTYLQTGGAIYLCLGSRVVVTDNRVAINGELFELSSLAKAQRQRIRTGFEILGEQRLLDAKYCNAITSDPVILEIFYKIYLAGFIGLLEKNKRS
jgi:50S ribosomal protein L16 3-hydroxylase